MLINQFSKHIFWSYKHDADLPDKIVIKQVVTYGEIKDLICLIKLYKKETIKEELKELKNKHTKRVYFVNKIILQ